MNLESRRHHLTDEEFSELLFGEQPDGAVAVHLASCDHCRAEFEAVGGSLGSLRELGTAWARTKAPLNISIPTQWARRLVSVPSWGPGLIVTTAAGVLAFALGLPSRHAAGHAPTAAAPAPESTIAEDNQLMQSIDQELSYRAPAAQIAAHPGHRGAHHSIDTFLD